MFCLARRSSNRWIQSPPPNDLSEPLSGGASVGIPLSRGRAGKISRLSEHELMTDNTKCIPRWSLNPVGLFIYTIFYIYTCTGSAAPFSGDPRPLHSFADQQLGPRGRSTCGPVRPSCMFCGGFPAPSTSLEVRQIRWRPSGMLCGVPASSTSREVRQIRWRPWGMFYGVLCLTPSGGVKGMYLHGFLI